MTEAQPLNGSLAACVGLWLAGAVLLVLALTAIPGWPRLAAAGAAVNLILVAFAIHRGTRAEQTK